MNTLQPMSPPFTEQQKVRWERIRSGGAFWFFFRFAFVLPLIIFLSVDLLPHYLGWSARTGLVLAMSFSISFSVSLPLLFS